MKIILNKIKQIQQIKALNINKVQALNFKSSIICKFKETMKKLNKNKIKYKYHIISLK
jgi:hypothetical protein